MESKEKPKKIEKHGGKQHRMLKEEHKKESKIENVFTDEIMDNEIMIFQLLKWGHLLTFFGILVQDYLKKRHHHYLAQFLQSIVTPAGYFFLMPVVIYTAKEYQNIWEH